MRIAIIGRTGWLYDTTRYLVDCGHHICGIITARSRSEYTKVESDFRDLAEELNCPFLLGQKINDEATVMWLRSLKADVGISVNWPALIGEAPCDVFRFGILNSHAGDLPRYRGNACPNWAILNGEAHIGLCIHRMDPSAIDAGPVIARRKLPINEETYISDVYRWLDGEVPASFAQALEHLEHPDFAPEIQSGSSVTPMRCYPRRPEDAYIDWSASSEQIGRVVRASSRPFAGAYTYLEGRQRVTVWKAKPFKMETEWCAVPGQVLQRRDSDVVVACGEGALLLQEFERDTPCPTLSVAQRFGQRHGGASGRSTDGSS